MHGARVQGYVAGADRTAPATDPLFDEPAGPRQTLAEALLTSGYDRARRLVIKTRPQPGRGGTSTKLFAE